MGCNLPPQEKVLEVDKKGRVLKTFDGQLTRKYDTLGNKIEFYGNVNYDDWVGCVHDKIFYNENNQETLRYSYKFEENDSLCLILDSLNYFEHRSYYSKSGKLIKRELYKPVRENGKIVGHKLSNTTNY